MGASLTPTLFAHTMPSVYIKHVGDPSFATMEIGIGEPCSEDDQKEKVAAFIIRASAFLGLTVPPNQVELFLVSPGEREERLDANEPALPSDFVDKARLRSRAILTKVVSNGSCLLVRTSFSAAQGKRRDSSRPPPFASLRLLLSGTSIHSHARQFRSNCWSVEGVQLA